MSTSLPAVKHIASIAYPIPPIRLKIIPKVRFSLSYEITDYPIIFKKKEGFAIKSAPANPIKLAEIYFHDITSFRNIDDKIITQRGAVKIKDIASPKGNKITPTNQQAFSKAPTIPRM